MHLLISDLWERHRLTIFMITHDLKEGFSLGSRLWVFDKVCHDPQAPDRWGERSNSTPIKESHYQTELPAGSYWSLLMRRGTALTLTDIPGVNAAELFLQPGKLAGALKRA